MSELAFDLGGDPIILPAHAQYWRVRRFRSPGTRGAPEVVTTREGAPCILPIDVGFLEFREIVENVPGRYRLDPIDEKRKIIGSNTPAYSGKGQPAPEQDWCGWGSTTPTYQVAPVEVPPPTEGESEKPEQGSGNGASVPGAIAIVIRRE
jgi:hypothetical protein